MKTQEKKMLGAFVDQETFEQLKDYCQENGYKQGFIIEQAILNYLEQQEEVL